MGIQQINIPELRPFVDNPKNHPGNQISMPKQCIWTNPIFIISDKMVLAGPARLPAAPEPGLFGGFSTTVIELHQLDTRYVDVIVQIYVNLTSNRELKRNWETYTWEERKAAQ